MWLTNSSQRFWLTAYVPSWLDSLGAPTQASFIPKRQASDNLCIAQEVIHTIRRSKSRNRLMAIKIDLAYDRISWVFLRETLFSFPFYEKWVELIMFCVENTSMSLLWNGEQREYFTPDRGLRQGSLRPYFFVLCMERLGHMILKEVQSGAWKPITLGKVGPSIYHLFFADDLFLFGRANENQAHVMRCVLEKFCGAYGAKISLEKSRLFISPKAANGHKRMMSRLLGITLINDLGKYLGRSL